MLLLFHLGKLLPKLTIEEIKVVNRIAVFGDKQTCYVDNDGSYQGYDIELKSVTKDPASR